MENLTVKLDKIEGNELVIRQGDALPAKEPVKLVVAGDIKTVSTFLKGRLEVGNSQKADPANALIVVDAKEMTIQLLLDPVSPYGGSITAKLELSDELKQFGINSGKMLNREEVIKLIKFNKLWFADADKHDTLLKAYQIFAAKTAAELAADNDNRGNKSASFKKTVQTDLPQEFILNIPIFKGQDRKKFRVEICLDISDNSVKFWFESVELHETIESEKERIFTEELKNGDGFVIIRK